ncbi:hypothetical protein NSB25_18115 [Acetatifactor muris]|uniref:Uncharacterized protein n=1 Tax=Acetatifactor muris TaxID=879566 RepID=A0A2K4ZKH2_9FIRM|nr:hypothetical protein [Acetatifactor muris]MCR2049185.1 hypothetical protein [Acetatifactor muris]SOY30896.1 hypothetical protein AMURIS_03630 [Acetatifactor muris]
MTVLLEFRERLKLIYSKYEVFILPLAKLFLAFVTFTTLNGRMGYMTRIDDLRIVLIAALACSFLPVGMLVLFATVFSLMHMYALSMEVALVGLCMYLVMYLLYFRFSPKDSLVVVLTPLLCAFKIPYVIPLAVGLLCGPSSVVSVGCGVAVFYLFQIVTDSAQNIRTMGDEDALAKVRMMVESILANKAMLVVIAAFAITVLVVYLIRRMSVNYAWTIAMIAGAMTEVVVLLIGDLLYDVNISLGGVLLGSLLALAVAKVIEFFRFCVDYSRTEKVQFEDDEYYYYVKAIPKMTVTVPSKTVKKINTQNVQRAGSGRSSTSRSEGETVGRRVTMEKTTGGKRGNPARQAQRPQNYRGERRNGRSVTIGSTYENGAGNRVGSQAENVQNEDEEWL